MVPPWVPDPESPTLPREERPHDDIPPNEPLEPNDRPERPIAPHRRFAAARASLGRFAQSGDDTELRRGLGHYVREGYGGARTASERLGGTPGTAAVLYNALADLAGGRQTRTALRLDAAILRGRSTREVIDALVDAVRPVDGTQDAEAARPAIGSALADLLTLFPDADLLNLTPEQRAYVIENFVAHDVFQRFALDVGKHIQDHAPTAAAGVSRLAEARDYIKEAVSASFRDLEAKGQRIDANTVADVARAALQETLTVFQDYLQ